MELTKLDIDPAQVVDDAMALIADCPFPAYRDWWAAFGIRGRGRDALDRKVIEHLRGKEACIGGSGARVVAVVGQLVIDISGSDVTLGRLDANGLMKDAITCLGTAPEAWDIDLSCLLPGPTPSPIPDRPYKVEVVDGLIATLGTIEVGLSNDVYYNAVDLDEIWVFEGSSLDEFDSLPRVLMQLELRNGLADTEWYAVLVQADDDWERVPGLLARRNGKHVADVADINARLTWGSVLARAKSVGEERDLADLSQDEFDEFLRLHVKPGEVLDEATEYIRECKGLDFPAAVEKTIEQAEAPLPAHQILKKLGYSSSDERLAQTEAVLESLLGADAIRSIVIGGESGTYAQGTLQTHTMVTYEFVDAPPLPPAPALIDLDALNSDLAILDRGDDVAPGPSYEPDPHSLDMETVIDWLRSHAAPAAEPAVVTDLVTGEELDLARAMDLLTEARTLSKRLDGAHTELANFEQANKDLDADLEETRGLLEQARDEIDELELTLKQREDDCERLETEAAVVRAASDAGALPVGMTGDIARLGKGVSPRLVTGLSMWVAVAHARVTGEEFVADSATHSFSDLESMADAAAWIEALAKRL